jgi:putative transposase
MSQGSGTLRIMTEPAPTASGKILRAYRFALEPTDDQVQMLRSHCGAQRFAYNWALKTVRANWQQRAAERTYGLADSELTPAVDVTAYGLRRAFNAVKDEIAPWWRENSKESYASGTANLSRALQNWARARGATRRGRRHGFPAFKTARSPLACTFTTGAIGLVSHDRRHVKLPRLGSMRTSESTRKLARRIAAGSAHIRSATVSYERGRWFVSFSVEVLLSEQPRPRAGDRVVGVDLGLHNLAVLSSPVRGVSEPSGVIANPQRYEAVQRQLRVLNRRAARRQGPDRRRGSSPSRRWVRAQARVRRLQSKVANQRLDGIHKLTAGLTKSTDVLVIEDLNVAGLIRNRSLARRIAGAGWGELRRQLTYKARWNGCEIVVANRFFGSSKTCSACGAAKAKLPLSERMYHCDECGLTVDRDANAARNLAALVAVVRDSSSPSCGATLNERAGNPRQAGERSSSGYRHGKSHVDNVAQ